MNDAEDNFDSLVPTEFDLNRLLDADASEDGRVEAENGTWVAIRYPGGNKQRAASWCPWSLIVSVSWMSQWCAPKEFKNLKAMTAYLSQLNQQRKRG